MKKCAKISLLLLIPFLGGSMVIAADWAQFHGPKRDNISPETGLLKKWPDGGPKLLWTCRKIGFGYSTVSIGGGLIYTAGNAYGDTIVTAMDLKGEVKWHYKCGPAWTSKRLWPGTRGTPTYENGRLYFESPVGDLVCLDAKTGKKIWGMNILSKFEGKNIRWALSESLLIDGDNLICAPGGSKGGLVALNKSDGKVVWTCVTGDQAGYASPIVVEQDGLRIIVTLTLKAMVGVNAKTGKLLWRVDHESYADENVLVPIYHDGHILVSTIKAGTRKWKLNVKGKTASVKQVWRSLEMDNHHGGIVLLDGYIYGSSCVYNRVRNKCPWICLDWKTGKKQYVDPGVGKGSLTVAEGMMYILSKDGTVGLVTPSPKAHTVVSRFNPPKGGMGPWWAHPVVCDGRLYIRHGLNLYVYDIRAKK